jgi:hypothetical protein
VYYALPARADKLWQRKQEFLQGVCRRNHQWTSIEFEHLNGPREPNSVRLVEKLEKLVDTYNAGTMYAKGSSGP